MRHQRCIQDPCELDRRHPWGPFADYASSCSDTFMWHKCPKPNKDPFQSPLPGFSSAGEGMIASASLWHTVAGCGNSRECSATCPWTTGRKLMLRTTNHLWSPVCCAATTPCLLLSLPSSQRTWRPLNPKNSSFYIQGALDLLLRNSSRNATKTKYQLFCTRAAMSESAATNQKQRHAKCQSHFRQLTCEFWS